MYVARYQVFDHGILTRTNVRLTSHYPPATRTQLELNLNLGEDARVLFRPEQGCLTVSRPTICDHTLQILLAYLMGLKSDVYDAAHAAGVVVDGKGILFVGGHGSGKSTLLGLFPGEPVLDDDVVVVDGTTMYSTGRHRPSQHRIDAVLLLCPDEIGGSLTQAQGRIPRSRAVFDALPPPLQREYCRLPPIPVAADVYRLGTQGARQRTRDAVHAVLRGVPHR